MSDRYLNLNTENLKSKAIKGAGINVVSHFIGFLFHAGGAILLARLLVPNDFGLVAMVAAFSMLPLNFGFNGFTEFIIQKKSLDNAEINSIFWTHVIISFALSILFILFGFFLVDFYSEPALHGIAAALSTGFILAALYTTPRALLKRNMEFSSLAIGDLSAGILSIIFAIIAAVCGMSYWAIVVRQLSHSLIQVVVAWTLCSWRFGRPRNLAYSLPALKYALKVFSNFILTYFSRNVDKIILGKFHGSMTLGYYDRAYYLSQLPATQLVTPLTSVALSTLARLRQDKPKFEAFYLRAVSTISFIGTVAAVVLMLTAEDLVLLLLGPAWMQTGKVLMVLSAAIAATLLSGTNSWLHLSLGKPGRWLRWNITAAAITIGAFSIAAPYGAVAMGIAYSAKSYILLLPGLWYAGRPIGLSPRKLFYSVWPYFIAAVLVCLSWLYLSANWPLLKDLLSEMHLVVRIVFVALVSSALYVALVAMIERSFKSVFDVASLVKSFLARR